MLKTKSIICVLAHLFIFFFHTLFHTYVLIIFALFHHSLKARLKKFHLSLRSNSYFLAIPNPQPVKTILEPNPRCVFFCWKPSLSSQASGQRATQLYNISLSIKQLGTKSSRWVGVWDGRTWRRSQKHQGTSTLSWAEKDRMCVGWHLGLVSHRYTYMDHTEFKAELKLRVSWGR